MADVVVAGHICVDLIPTLPEAGFRYRPGTLVRIGPVMVSTGGCVPNTGLALHRLGTAVRLLGKVGDDPFGSIVRESLSEIDRGLAGGILVDPGENTSYTVVLNPPGEDRMFLHFPGANDAFAESDIPEDALSGARVFHFGYPPIMRRMYEDGGENLARMLERAKEAGLTTSLDMAYPDPATPAGRADWLRILERALPLVDVFVPSLEELLMMVDPQIKERLTQGEESDLSDVPVGRISELGERLVEMGVGIAAIKLGERGLFLRTAAEKRLRRAGPGGPPDNETWAGRELWSPVFEVEAAGTAGAGDATVAGFLHALLGRLAPEDAVCAACAVGASSVEAADATSGVRSWEETRERMDRGWRRREALPGEGWLESERGGVWAGPRDRGPAGEAG